MGPNPYLWFLDAKQQLMDRNNKTLWVPVVTCRFVLAKRRDLQQNVKFLWDPALICVLFHAKQRLYDQTYKSVWVPALIWGFCLQTRDFWTKIACLYGSQNSPVVFCMQNSMPSIINTSLYVSQPSSVVFECKTAHFGPELQVFKGTRPHLSFCVCNTV